MRLATRCSIALGSAALMVATASAVWGDTVRNYEDDTVDAIAEVVTMNLGADDSVSLSVEATADSKKGCNIDSGEVLVVNATSQKPNVALVSNDGIAFSTTTTVTFSNCTTPVSVGVKGMGLGTGTVAFSIAAATTAGGTFKMNAATFQVRVVAAG